MRSERRQRCHGVHVRLTPAEYVELKARAAAWNALLPPDVSPHARMTVPRILVAAAIRSDIPRTIPAPPVPVLTAEQQAEMRQLRMDAARLGNLFRAWIEHGSGVYRGKGGQDIEVKLGPTRRQIRDGDELIAVLTDVQKRISEIIG